MYSFAILNSQAFKIDISEILVGKTGIQSALAQQDNSTTDDEPADDEPADDEPADDEPADDEPADDEPADDDNKLPKADDKDVETNQDEAVDIQLTGTDEDGDEVTFYIKRFPSHGSLDGVDEDTGYVTGDDNVVTYDPEDGFVGEDSFSVRPSDGRSSGQIGYISIKVNQGSGSTSSGQLPVANAGSDQTVHSSEEVHLDGTGS